jgi:DnaA family protein
MSKQLPLQFEFRANQTFGDFFASNNQEIVSHLQNSVAGHGEVQIFLWGDSGLGKSHLLQACCHLAHTLKRSSFYLDLAAPHLPDAAILTGVDELDVVCLDNVEQIAGNKDWEIAVFNFFNRHRDSNHTLILSACCLPNDIAIQLPDLKTRLNWGLTLKIQPLASDDKITALIFKANQMGFEISPQVGLFLLTHYDRDLSALWQLLAQLDEASLSAKCKLTIPFLKKILSDTEQSHV